MAHGFRNFISEVFVNGKFPKISCYTVTINNDSHFATIDLP